MPVHYSGQPCDMEKILGIAKKKRSCAWSKRVPEHRRLKLTASAGQFWRCGRVFPDPLKNLNVWGDGGDYHGPIEGSARQARIVAQTTAWSTAMRFTLRLQLPSSTRCRRSLDFGCSRRLSRSRKSRIEDSRPFRPRTGQDQATEGSDPAARTCATVYHLYMLHAERRDELVRASF